jgi:demethylspheroidene O-methyltransferase
VALPSFIKRLRNRLIADPKFIAFAQRFVLTRPVARRQSVELFDLLAGFSYSQTLYACVRLNIIGLVGQGGISLDALAKAASLDIGKAALLTKAAVALGILDSDGEHIILGPHGAALLAQPWIMRFIEHHSHFYRDLEDPVALLRGEHVEGGLRDYWRYDQTGEGKAAYSALMAASQAAVSEQVLRAYDFGRHSSVLDVGGGSGAFLSAVGARHPHLKLNLFDLPGVVALPPTDSAIAIERHGGDFRSDRLPDALDLVTVVRVVHDHDDAAVLALLKNIRRSCGHETVLMITEPFAGNRSTARVTDAYFNLYFAAMGQGRTRTPAEIAALAAEAGFTGLRIWPTDMPLIAGVITFHPKPE